ncbi:MAG: hypothetical protein IT342_12480 [Candidatus Melainabacteria bacterium]|nr:hypothetical protein [Candidatus Melainabacteria bacterium]
MYQTTTQFILAAKTLKEALLLSLAVGKPLRIETGRPGEVPCIPCQPYDLIINDHLSLQAVDPREQRGDPDRRLKRELAGKVVRVFTNFDSWRFALNWLSRPESHILLILPGDNASRPAEAMHDWLCYSVSLSMPPDAIVELLNYVAEDSQFSDQNITALKESTEAVSKRASPAFLRCIVNATRATRPDTEESAACRNIGLTASFGCGAGVRADMDLLMICAAHAVLNGRSEVREEDLVRFFPAVVAHRIAWAAATPFCGYAGALTKVAEWAVRV